MKLTLIRSILGVEVYRDETGREYLARADGSLELIKPAGR